MNSVAPEKLPVWVRAILALIGLVSVSLGILGAFLPLLPTTPFLLLGAACFVRSSDRLYSWLMNHKVLGPYIRNYREHRAITRRTLIVALTLLWVSIGYSVLLVADLWWVRILLVGIAAAVTWHLVSLNTMPAEAGSAEESNNHHAGEHD